MTSNINPHTLDMNVPLTADLVYIPPEVESASIQCPAGEAFRHDASYPACLCRVDMSTVSAKTSPNGYKKWCTDKYQECPVWRMKRERELAEKYKQEQHRY